MTSSSNYDFLNDDIDYVHARNQRVNLNLACSYVAIQYRVHERNFFRLNKGQGFSLSMTPYNKNN